jgi:hypothetical protein
MITGNDMPTLKLLTYADAEDLLLRVKDFLQGISHS